MVLSDTAIVSGSTATVNGSARGVVAVVCAASAGIHLALVPEHYTEGGPVLAGAFLLSAVLLAAAAAVGRRPSGAGDVAVALVLLGVVAAFVLSRTTGLPPLIEEREPLDVLGSVTTIAEVAAVLVLGRLPHYREERR